MIHRFSFGAALFLFTLGGMSIGMSHLTHPLNLNLRRMGLSFGLMCLIGSLLFLIASGAEV